MNLSANTQQAYHFLLITPSFKLAQLKKSDKNILLFNKTREEKSMNFEP